LKKIRVDAFEMFCSLPVENSQVFKKNTFFLTFGLDEVAADDLIDGSTVINKSLELDAYVIQSGSKSVLHLSNDLEKKGVVLKEIKQAMKEDEKLVKEFFNNRNREQDKMLFFNDAFFNCGFFFHVPRNIDLQIPLFVLNLGARSKVAKNFIFIDENSKADIIKEDYSENQDHILFSENFEVNLKDGAQMTFSNLQMLSQNTLVLSNCDICCGNESKVFMNVGHFGGAKVRSRVNNFLIGDGASVEDLEIAFGNNRQNFDLYSGLNHIGKSTVGKVMSKGMFKNKSMGLLKGMIKIGEEAKNSNSYLSGHAILLSEDAKADVIPSLEIKTDEVKATHSVSVAPIDREKIFYLMTRGLSLNEAKKQIAFGFFAPVIENVNSEEAKIKLQEAVELKWMNKEGYELSKKVFDVKSRLEKKIKDDIFGTHYKYR